MTQYVINIGAIPNDGTGDPLRTAFNEVNLNFNQVWATGLVGSNLQIANNTIFTTNTNGNLVLNPNGIGNVIANAHVIPDQTRVRNLGSATQRWDTVYAQYANIAGTLAVAGDLTVNGNLSVTGNIVEVGNIITDAKTIQLANTAGTANSADGSGITVGANDSIATFLYDSTDNAWVTNVRFETGNLILTDDRIMDLYGPSITNADLISGATSGLDIVPNGDANATVLFNTYGNILLQTSNTGANLKTFTFDYNGNLTLLGTVSAVGNITGNYFIGNGSQLTGLPASYGNSNVVNFLANFGSNTISTSGNITGGNIFGNIQAADGNTSVMFNQEGFLGADAGFSYDYAANTLYVETVSILGKNNLGAEAIYAGVTGFTALGSNVVAQLAGNANTYTQINFQNISESPQASGDYIVTANNGTDDSNFIDLGIAGNTWDGTQPNSLGTDVEANDGYLYVNGANLVVGTAVTGGNVNTWKFDTTGNLTAGGNLVPKTSNAYSLGNATNQWSDLYVSNATIYMNNVPIGLTAGNVLTVDGADVVTTNANGQANVGNLDITGATVSIASGDPDTLITISPNIEGQAYIQVPTDSTANAYDLRIHNDAGNIEFGTNSGASLWYFTNTGTTVFPTLTVNLHNGGNQNAQTLQFGNPDYQAVITGPTPAVNNNAQRLIIQGQRGNGTGEGGDVYVWAGDAENNGGDIKIYAGDADAGNVGDLGGYINIDGGSGYTRGGQVEITGGYSASGDGGYANLLGGTGGTYGGNVGIQAGYGQAGPGGAVTIQGGISANGLAEYGNVNIVAGASTWTFDNAGNLSVPGAITSVNNVDLYAGDAATITSNNTGTINTWTFDETGNVTLPSGGSLYSEGFTPSGNPGNTIILNPHGSGSITNQKLMLYPTAGDGDHLHMTTGNLYQTELFLGSDDFYVKLANTGNVVINTNDSVGNSTQWTFDTTGILTLPGEGVLRSIGDSVTLQTLNTISGNANSVYLGSSGGLGFNDQEIGGNWLEIFRTGTEPEIRVPVGRGNLNIQTASGNTPYNWVLDDTGNLSTPGSIIMPSNSVLTGTFASPAPSINGFDSISAVTLSATGNVTGGNVLTSGNISATGNVTGNYFIGNGSQLTGIATSTISGNLAGNLLANGFFINNLTALSVSGNITGGNILGNGYALTGIRPQVTATNSGGALNIMLATNFNGPANAVVGIGTSGGPATINPGTGQLVVAGATVGGYGLSVDGGGQPTTGTISATGNIAAGGNILATGYASVTGNVTGGNIRTAGLISATGNITGGNITTTGNVSGNTAGFAIGYRDIPQVSFTGNATIATTDAGKHYYSTLSTGNVLTIANNASQGFQVGAAITIVNQGTGNITVAQDSGVTLYLAGNATAGNRTVATFGMATLIKVATDTWFINGTGVS